MTLKTNDVAISTGVSHCTIRDYSDKGLLGPIERSESSSYRAFDPLLFSQVHLVKTLRESGCTTEQLNEYGERRTPKSSLTLLRKCGETLANEIAALQARLDILQSHAALIEEGLASQPGEIELRNLPERRLRMSPLQSYRARRKEVEQLREAYGKIRFSGNAGCPLGYAYQDFFGLMNQPDQPSYFVSYDPKGPEIRPAGEYLVGTVNCAEGVDSSFAQRMFRYAVKHNLEPVGPVYAVYLLSAASVTETEQYLLQIVVAVQPSKEQE